MDSAVTHSLHGIVFRIVNEMSLAGWGAGTSLRYPRAMRGLIGLAALGAVGCVGGGGECEPVTCALFCEHGFATGPDGCEVCRCNPPPEATCTVDEDCVIGRDYSDCCACPRAFSNEQVDVDLCVAAIGRPVPPDCVPSPEMCTDAMCRCTAPVRATCVANRCLAVEDCLPGTVPVYARCVPACASHADCSVGANYGECCGGCGAHHVSLIAGDMCLAERASESSCWPAPSACDGLGCASPPDDCVATSDGAVCLEDGSCTLAGPGGSCPTGTSDDGSRCLLDP